MPSFKIFCILPAGMNDEYDIGSTRTKQTCSEFTGKGPLLSQFAQSLILTSFVAS